MRPAPLDIQTQGSLGGRVTAMSLDQSSLVHIMSVLTDLYSDPVKAIIREYSTNALDAHAMIGNDAPIEIHTPNQLSPFFKVRDFGPGMSVDFIENVYSQYGNSTKRETDTQVGMLGLGGKSGLTYTAQFQIVSIHNGVKIHVMVSKSEDGSGVMEIVDTSMTDEPSGVEVIIPVRYTNEFTNKVRDFFKFWKPGSVLVDGVAPNFVGDAGNAIWVTDSILALPEVGDSYVVMGNVPYRAEGLADRYSKYRVVAFVPIGSVAFPPNREELMYTEQTKATIAAVAQEAKDALATVIQKEIDTQDTYLDALRVWDKMSAMVDFNFTYQGESIKDVWRFNFGEEPALMKFYPGHERNAVSLPSGVNWKDFAQYLTITGYTADKIPTGIRQRIREYIRQSGKASYQVFLMEEHPDLDKLAGIRTVDIDTIKAVKLPKVERKARELELSALTSSGYFGIVDELDEAKRIVYIIPGRRKFKWRNFAGLVSKLEIVTLKKAEVKKFLTAYPDAENFEQWIIDNLRYAVAGLTSVDKRRLGDVDYYSRRAAEKLDSSRIDDPEMVAFVENVQTKYSPDSDTLREYNRAVSYATAIDYYDGQYDASSIPDPFDRYPLAKTGGAYREHVYIYMNAVFAAEQKEKDNQV